MPARWFPAKWVLGPMRSTIPARNLARSPQAANDPLDNLSRRHSGRQSLILPAAMFLVAAPAGLSRILAP
jgi:hypothetical protein